MTWTNAELDAIGTAEELEISPSLGDGTPHGPVTIWVVRVGDDLYVRAYRGRDGAWYRAAQSRHEGHIQAGGVDKDVTFADEKDQQVNEQIDDAYQTKYNRYGPRYVDPMMAEEARSTTIKLLPR
ncbi:DUF2255 family protein [Nonomuraea sp. NPDC050536]|uniref:DUF2255 family protein n=1 Tax=Nonomuraea sp. NPDC050536 TaxID=3364366 RepID=UPI0037C5EDDE